MSSDEGDPVLEAMDVIRIHQLLGAYGHTIDDRDWDSFAALFEPDAVLDYTAVRAPVVCHGIDEILHYFRGANHPSAHHVTNIVVDERTAATGRVAVRSKFFAPFTRPTHSPRRWFGGEYRDVVVRNGGTWTFAEKTCLGGWILTPGIDDDVPAHRRTS
jgi:3-phenylpropionate/cinnamic acid dioxygenase small subunit